MRREIDLAEISDGKLYGLNDMVRADCDGCRGCAACCRGMGDSIVLDPLDICRLTAGLDCSFEALLAERLELHVVDGIILPNLKMTGESESCSFLNKEGRCSIHGFRPGICRLFPLGRIYENHSFQYFLQVKECAKENKTKVKVRKWIDMPMIKEYETFVIDWHYFLLEVQKLISDSKDENTRKTVSMFLLKHFFMTPYNGEMEFYRQFGERLTHAGTVLGLEKN